MTCSLPCGWLFAAMDIGQSLGAQHQASAVHFVQVIGCFV